MINRFGDWPLLTVRRHFRLQEYIANLVSWTKKWQLNYLQCKRKYGVGWSGSGTLVHRPLKLVGQVNNKV